MAEQFGALRPFNTETHGPAGRGKGGPPQVPKQEQIKPGPIDKDKVVKQRKTPGRKSDFTRAFFDTASKEGNIRKAFSPKDNLTAAEVKQMYHRLKGSTRQDLLKTLVSDQQREMVTQFSKLSEDIMKAAGSDKRSSRYALALLVAKTINDNFTHQKIAQAATEKGAEGLIPFFQHWTWLYSNKFVLGDSRAYMDPLSTDTKDKKKIKKREDEYTNFERKKKPEIDTRILDKIGEELDRITRWARSKRHNDTLQTRIDAFRKANPGKPIVSSDPDEFRRIEATGFPHGGFVQYLANELKAPDLQADALLEKIGDPRLTYVPYQFVSDVKKKEAAVIERQKKEAKPGILQRESKKEAAKKAATIERQAELSRLVGDVQKQADILKALLSALDAEKSRPQELGKIVDVVRNAVAGYNGFLQRAQDSMPPKDGRGFFGRRTKGKEVGTLEQSKLQGYVTEFKRLEKRHWTSLEKRINDTLGALGTEAQTALGTVKLAELDIRGMPQWVQAIKNAISKIRAPKAPESRTERLEYLKDAVVPRLTLDLKIARNALDLAYKERDALNKGATDYAARKISLDVRIQDIDKHAQSLDSQIKHIARLLGGPEKTKDPKKPVDPQKAEKTWEQQVKTASNKYRSKRIR